MEIPKVVKELPPAPSDVMDWILKDVVRNTYIIFETKTKRAYCTRCKTHFSMYDLNEVAKHNEETICPECGENAILKSKGIGRKKLEEQTRVLTFVRKGKSIYGVLTEIDISFEEEAPSIFKWISAVYKFNSKEQLYYKHYPGWCYNGEKWEQLKNIKIPSISTGGYFCTPKRQGLHIYTKNFSQIFNKSDFKYLDINGMYEKHLLSGNELINLLNLSMKYQSIELLYKSGFEKIVLDKIDDYPHYSASVYWKGKDLRKILRMNFGEIKEFRNEKLNLSTLKTYQDYRKAGYKLNVHELEVINCTSEYTINSIEKTVNVSHIKITKYLARQNFNGVEKVSSNRLSDYNDYIKDCVKLGLDIRKNKILFPEVFHEKHMELVNIIAEKHKQELAKANKKKERAIKKFIKEFFKGKEIYKNNKFIIRPAISAEELNVESSILGHCVRSYMDRIANKFCLILFIRQISDVNTPYYTLELSPKYNIVQCRGKKNCSTTDEVQAFVDEWYQNVVTKLEKQSKASKQNKKVKAIAVA